MVLVNVLAVGLVTSTVIVQVLLAVIVPPDSETVFVPETAVTAPPHVVTGLFGVAMKTSFAAPGSVSVNATLVRLKGLVLPSVIVRVETPPAEIVAGEKALATVGG